MMSPSRGGRPTLEDAEKIRDRILDSATELFLSNGYGSTSIEAVAQSVRVSKRTFYTRFRDKAELFDAVVRRIVGRLRPADLSPLFIGDDLEEILLRLAKLAIAAALSPEAISLQRLILSEAARFPELAAIVVDEGSRQDAVEAISRLLRREPWGGGISLNQAEFAANQFLQLTMSLPQHQAMGLGSSMSSEERTAWAESSVRLFLKGFHGFTRPSETNVG